MAFVVGELLARLKVEDTGVGKALDDTDRGLKKVDQQATQTGASVKKMATDNAAAYQRQQAAAKRLLLAEQELAAAKKTGEASNKQLLQLEARVASARATAIGATSRYTSTSRQLAAAHRDAGSAAAQHTSQTNQLSATLVRTRTLLASLGVGLSAAATVKFFTDSIAAARALGAQTNQLNVVFGENDAKITSWASNAVNSMRMSQREAQGAAVTFATFGKAMGLAGDDLVKFSTQQTKLAADLASFQGIPVADAIEAMGSAFAGETETMRKYGVLLDENTIKQAAYRHGIAEVGSQLTATQKQQAMYYAMQEQLAHVNGDVERSNGKFGASLKTLTARFEETQAAVGQKLIPVVQPFVDLLSGPGLSAVQGLAGGIGALGQAFGSLPGPVQAALAAMVAFRLAQRFAGDQIAAFGQRATAVYTTVRTSMSDMTRAAVIQTTQGSVAMGRFGSSIAGIGRHVPVIARMQQSFVQAAVTAERFPRSAGMMAAGMTGIRSAASGLMGVLGGPWGIAIMAATAALGFFISKKQEAAQRAAEAKAKQEEWAQALRESGGAINENVRNLIALELQHHNLLSAAEKSGVGMKNLTEAVTGSTEEFERAKAAMVLYAAAENDAFGAVTEINRQAEALQQIRDNYTGASDAAKNLNSATGDGKIAFDSSAQSTKSMSKAMEEYKEETGGAAAQVDKLAKALKGLADDQLTQEEATQSWHDSLRDLTKTLGETSGAIIKHDGAIDVTTEKGSKLQDVVVKQRDAYLGVAAAAKRYTDEQQQLGKMNAGQALDYMNQKLGPLRKSFIDAAMAANYTKEQAEALADRYLGVPGQITTQLELKGADAAISKLDQLKVKGAAKIEGTYHVTDNTPQVRAKLDQLKVDYEIIDGKIVIDENGIVKARGALAELGVETESLPEGFVKITDTSAENIARLRQLGIEVHTLPNGTIVINAEDAAFWQAVAAAQQPGEKKIVLTPQVNQAAMSAAMAAIGGPVAGAAAAAQNADGSIRQYVNGGIHAAEQYANGAARLPNTAVIQPADPRGGLVQWAEPSTKGEAFIPMAEEKRPRSLAILAEVARRFGMRLLPAAGDSYQALMNMLGFRAMEEGGITAGALKNYMRGIDGAQYVWGGWGQGFNTDCSGGQSIAANATVGNTSAGSGERSATAGFASWLPKMGYILGRAPNGVPAHEIGWSSEHASGTIFDPVGGDVNIEMGGGNGGGAYGRGAVSSRDAQFPEHAYKILGGDDGSTNSRPTYSGGDKRGFEVKGVKAQNDSGGDLKVFDEDEAPDTSPGGGRLIAYHPGDKPGTGWAQYGDGWISDGQQWIEGANITQPTAPSGFGGSPSGSGTPVYVTGGRLDSVGASSPSSTTPTTPSSPGAPDSTPGDRKGLTLRTPFLRGQKPLHLRTGGTVPGTGSGDIVPAMLEPGEKVVPKAQATRWADVIDAIIDGRTPGYQDGGTVGFGGYADDTSDYMKPKNWRDAIALATGAGFTAASVAGPYIGMLQSGQVDLGSLAPTADTGSNDIPAIGEMVGDYAGQISSQLAEIAQLLAKGERVHITIESDDNSAANMVAMAAKV